MILELQVKKKQFTDRVTGEIRQYYDLRTNLDGHEFKLRADEKDKKMFNYFLDKCDIPLEQEDNKEELMRKLLAGEYLSSEEKAVLKGLLEGEG